MALAEEFKKFVARGNVVDLAIGVIIGAAFSSHQVARRQHIFAAFESRHGTSAPTPSSLSAQAFARKLIWFGSRGCGTRCRKSEYAAPPARRAASKVASPKGSRR